YLTAGEKATLLIIGGSIGAFAALLLAPKAGVEIRGGIAGATRKGYEKTRETAVKVGGRASDYYETTRDKANELITSATGKAAEIIDTTKENAQGLVEQVKETAVRPKNTFAAAIEAGKRAYFEEKRRTESAAISTGRAVYPTELGETKK
ncbi:MAG: YtxH domain-containing protein, partial [Pyrinomonadaceae bacterium]|nr:YtxH domain-containing protein [Pyrinomonadaceae bacterium]